MKMSTGAGFENRPLLCRALGWSHYSTMLSRCPSRYIRLHKEIANKEGLVQMSSHLAVIPSPHRECTLYAEVIPSGIL